MQTFVQEGNILSLLAPYDVTSGNGLLVGSIFGVAATDALSGEAVEAQVVGVFDVAKATGALTAGQKIYWDNTAKKVTGTASGNTLVGGAVRAAASGDATARVRLSGAMT